MSNRLFIEFQNTQDRNRFLVENRFAYKGNQIFIDYHEAPKHPAAHGDTLCCRFIDGTHGLKAELWMSIELEHERGKPMRV